MCCCKNSKNMQALSESGDKTVWEVEKLMAFLGLILLLVALWASIRNDTWIFIVVFSPHYCMLIYPFLGSLCKRVFKKTSEQ